MGERGNQLVGSLVPSFFFDYQEMGGFRERGIIGLEGYWITGFMERWRREKKSGRGFN